ncbi:hypothetical protein OESDEN_23665 [Oesophagostomum dentatum]|uniref:Neurotransmitter-gated ion-channel ligand-binding domain-containing protein n=1 Tax=Oesophagostomum dentatum TaxID=61180 RepID=A0A0B1S0K1_OESDE|nr:hypothetical protein OESDEN_23665 [Oesophagostomum dentatum]
MEARRTIVQQCRSTVRQHMACERSSLLVCRCLYFISLKSNIDICFSNGNVTWIPPAVIRSSCNIDIAYFPFDSQVSLIYKKKLFKCRSNRDDS